jgi:aminoglycoside 3-N-acetyltransferase I
MNDNEFEVKHLNKTNLLIAEQLFAVLNYVFDVKNPIAAKAPYLNKLLDNPGFICFAALYKNEVIGGLTAYQLPMYYAECAEMYIYDIAVKPSFQRIGVGKRLLLAAKEYCKENGIKEMFVDASDQDKKALDFYRSMQGQKQKVVQFTFKESMSFT